jgi:hypothetical protein
MTTIGLIALAISPGTAVEPTCSIRQRATCERRTDVVSLALEQVRPLRVIVRKDNAIGERFQLPNSGSAYLLFSEECARILMHGAGR